MINKLFTSLLFLVLTNQNIFATNWLWAYGQGGTAADLSARILYKDDIYIAGKSGSTSCYFQTGILNFYADGDPFICKFSNSGTPIWTLPIRGYNQAQYSHEGIIDMVADVTGENIYIAGPYGNSLTIDTIVLPGSTINPSVFLSKIDSTGKVVWAKSFGSDSIDDACSIDIDSSGNIYMTSIYRADDIFSGINVTKGVILAKFDSNGNCLWAKNIASNVFIKRLRWRNNSLWIGGWADYQVDSFSIGNTVYDNTNRNIFVARLDTDGNFIWSRKDGWNNEYLMGLDVDQNSNLFFTGQYRDSTIIGNDTLTGLDLYLAKFDGNGNFQWTKNFGGHNYNRSFIWGSHVDLNGNIYVSGDSGDTITIDTTVIYDPNGFVFKFSNSGNFMDVVSLSHTTIYDFAFDNNSRIVACGQFGADITTNSGTISTQGLSDSFVALHDMLTGNEEIEKRSQNELLIYANPTTGHCTISLPDELLKGNKQLLFNLYDNTGKLLQSKRLDPQSDSFNLNLEQEAKGNYLVTLSDGKKLFSGRVVFQ